MPLKTCMQCGSEYNQGENGSTWFKKSKFCSKQCTGKYLKATARDIHKLCEGCGQEIVFPEHFRACRRRAKRFCSYECRSLLINGSAHSNWQGGNYKVGKGYFRQNIGIGQTQYQHRVIAERVLGRKLKRSETVHHINANKEDNRNSNLLICTNSYHRWLHGEMSRRYAQEHFGSRSAA